METVHILHSSFPNMQVLYRQYLTSYVSPYVMDEEMEVWRGWWLMKVIEQVRSGAGTETTAQGPHSSYYSSVI